MAKSWRIGVFFSLTLTMVRSLLSLNEIIELSEARDIQVHFHRSGAF